MRNLLPLIIGLFFFCNRALCQPYLNLTAPIIDKEVILESSIEKIWQAWTTEEGIEGFLAPSCSIELKPGGKYEMYFQPHAKPGFQGSEGSEVLSFIPNEMFSFSWAAPTHFPELRSKNIRTWVVINLEKSDSKRVRLRLRQFGWKEGKPWINLYNYYDETWEAVLIWLKEYLEG